MRLATIFAIPARYNQKEPVPFQELLPLKLKDRVSGKGEKSSDVVCLQEMSILFACLKKNDFNQSVCSKEIGNFQKCYTTSLTRKQTKKDHESKGILTPGQRNLTHKQINQLLKRFPDL